MGKRLQIVPVSLAQAKAFIVARHRHRPAPVGHKFSLGVAKEGRLVGVAVVSRPVARAIDHSLVAEVSRLCTDGTPNACSMLYAASARAAAAMGYARIITYTLSTEPGTSLLAAGWTETGNVTARKVGWANRPSRANAPLVGKRRWEKELRQPAPPTVKGNN